MEQIRTLAEDHWKATVISVSAVLLAVIILHFSITAALAGAVSLGIGYYSAKLLLLNSQSFIDLSPFLLSILESDLLGRKPLPFDEEKSENSANNRRSKCFTMFGSASDGSDTNEDNLRRVMPWEELEIPTEIDSALNEFIQLTLKTYVTNWYYELLSDDTSFLIEVRYQIRYLLSVVCRKLLDADLTGLILDKLTPIAIAHAHTFQKARQLFAGESGAVLEQRVLDYMKPHSLHRAMHSRQSELTYLRNLASALVDQFVDEDRLAGWKPQMQQTSKVNGSTEERVWAGTPSVFLRELLTFAFLLPVLDLIGDPEIINDLLILLFDPEPMVIHDEPNSGAVPIGYRLTEIAVEDSPDSLLQFKLTDVMRHPTMLYLFMNYLKDVQGPIHQLQFLLACSEMQHRLRATENETGTLTKENLSHLHWEAWEIYKNYFHPTSPDSIDFPSDLSEELKCAVEIQSLTDSLPLIDKALLKAYRLVYHRVHFDFVIPFCQSEDFLSRLAGDRISPPSWGPTSGPRSARGVRQTPKGGNSNVRRRLAGAGVQFVAAADQGFTFQKFRNKFFGVFTGAVEDGSAVVTAATAVALGPLSAAGGRQLRPTMSNSYQVEWSSPKKNAQSSMLNESLEFASDASASISFGITNHREEEGEEELDRTVSTVISADDTNTSIQLNSTQSDSTGNEYELESNGEISRAALVNSNLLTTPRSLLTLKRSSTQPEITVDPPTPHAGVNDFTCATEKLETSVSSENLSLNTLDEVNFSTMSTTVASSSVDGDSNLDIDVEDDLLEGIIDERRDINRWRVRIPRVEPRRDNSGKTIYVYVVSVERLDIGAQVPNRMWLVDRRYNEFYVLEAKLTEFHGVDVVSSLLPPKKTFVNKGRAFVESLRPSFEVFIQRLTGNAALKGSDLLASFLSSPAEEFTQSALFDLNPWRAMKRVPAKLSRERGQNLTRCLCALDASVITGGMADSTVSIGSHSSLVKSKSGDFRSEGGSSGSSQFSMLLGDKAVVREKVFGTIYGNNCSIQSDDGNSVGLKRRTVSPVSFALYPTNNGRSTGSVGGGARFRFCPLTVSLFDSVLYVLWRILAIGRPLMIVLVSLRTFLRDTLTVITRVFLSRLLRLALHEINIIKLIELVSDALYYRESKPLSDSERREQKQLARIRAQQFLFDVIPNVGLIAIGRHRILNTIDLALDGLQYPRLNKQLSYVLLDTLIQELFPDIAVALNKSA